MVKKWVVMVALTIILVVGCVYESKYIHSSFSGLINSLETLQIEITENKEKIDTEELITKSYNLHDKWHKSIRGIKCMIWHTGVKDIEVGFARIAAYVEENEYADAYAEIASLIDYIAHYLDDFKISIENVL
ncbi:MAG: DUF4363 family protein [Clostridia bacterium]|nr:DUF4363 family protein [Clostridia bacterium]